ncbi:MAG: hypothetical protein JFR38_02675 [Muribaculaceae bacterium]|nr:hypothetical protein [Muribaculaceae bacterium]
MQLRYNGLNCEIEYKTAETEAAAPVSAVDVFEDILATLPLKTRGSYGKALRAFKKSLQGGAPTLSALSVSHVKQWIAAMATDGVRLSTACHYLDCMSALAGKAVEAGYALDREVFAHAPQRAASGEIVTSPDALLAIGRQARPGNAQCALSSDLLLFSQYSGGMPLGEIIKLEQADAGTFRGPCAEIAARYRSERRRALFPLSQSRRAHASIEAEQSRRIGALLSSAGSGLRDYSPGVAVALWAAAALAAGIEPSIVRACIGDADTGTALQLVDPASGVDVSAVHLSVASFVSHAPERWHAMRLRRGILPADVEARIAAAGLSMPATFYPMTEVVRRVGHRMQRDIRAFIPDVLFFKTTDTAIAPLLRTIGDIAWCYRETNSPQSPYAVISDAQMLAFQRIIGSFTPDVELMRPTLRDLGIGRRVRITAGAMCGYEGVIHDVPASLPGHLCSKRRIFSISFLSDFGMQWSVDIDEAFIEEL